MFVLSISEPVPFLEGVCVGFRYKDTEYFYNQSNREEKNDKEYQKTPNFLRNRGSRRVWCWQELNRRHMDFQSIALPPELQHR